MWSSGLEWWTGGGGDGLEVEGRVMRVKGGRKGFGGVRMG